MNYWAKFAAFSDRRWEYFSTGDTVEIQLDFNSLMIYFFCFWFQNEINALPLPRKRLIRNFEEDKSIFLEIGI